MCGGRLTVGIEDGEVSIEEVPPGVEISRERLDTPNLP